MLRLPPEALGRAGGRARELEGLPRSARGESKKRPQPPPPLAGKSAARLRPVSSGTLPNKPKFLQDIEAYIETELLVLGVDASAERRGHAVEAQRLQVFREAFHMLLADFRTYRPLLSMIMREYEAMIGRLTGKLDEYRPLVTRVQTMELEHKRELERRQHQHEQTVRERDESHARLENRVDQMGLEMDALRGKLAHTHKLLAEATAEVEEGFQARKTLIGTITGYQDNMVEREGRREDAVSASHQYKKELTALQTEYDGLLKENYLLKERMTTMVAHETFRAAEAEIKRVKAQLEAFKQSYNQLRREYVEFKNSFAKREANMQSMEEEGRSKTPRPDWSEVVDGFNVPDLSTEAKVMSMSKEISKLRMQREKLRDQVFELKAYLPKEELKQFEEEYSPATKHFTALGHGPEVPQYLRFTGRVRNRHLAKRDTELMLKDIWAQKQKYDRDKTTKTKLRDFVFFYLQKRFGIQSMIAEWGYNLVDALQRYQFDADHRLFFAILNGEADEEVYEDQIELVERLKRLCHRVDMRDTGRTSGKVPKRDLIPELRKFFAAKSDRDFEALVDALNKDQPGLNVAWKRLFVEDREGNQTTFVERARSQHLAEREQLLAEIEAQITEAAKPDADGTDKITVAAARRVLKEIDPRKPGREIDLLLQRGFGSTQLRPDTAVSASIFLRLLHSGLIRRTGRRAAADDADSEPADIYAKPKTRLRDDNAPDLRRIRTNSTSSQPSNLSATFRSLARLAGSFAVSSSGET